MHIEPAERIEHAQDIPISTALSPTEDHQQHAMHLLREVERQQLMLWNTTQQGACIQQLVATQAEVRPEAVALIVGQQRLSYRELNQQANQLAHYLQTLGVGPGVLVGLCVERSLAMVVGLLGILKAGGAYVPLDPTYPAERLSFMISDAHIPVLVTQQYLQASLPTQDTHVVCLDADVAQLAQYSTGDPSTTAAVTDLVYVVYTSGSTGQPKGVQITHDSLLNLVFWHQRVFAVTSADRATQVTSPAFDATGWELWPYLTIGACVYLADEDTRVSPEALRDWLIHKKITITFLPTALAERVMALEWPTTVPLRFLLTGADVLHHYPPSTLPFALVNNYGPTEATVVATSGLIPPMARADLPPSIGRPIANTQIYLLDEQLREVSIGEPGELYIGGVGLAHSYLNRPELTAERFIPHPFSDILGARLYKTGDLARYLADGQIAFMGRTDQQIKVRGYRIEPAEIISRLNEHPSIQTSMVIAHEDAQGDKQLVAYIVATPGTSITVGSLRDSLTLHLPDYMVPAAFVLLEDLPLTPNGKIDRSALPVPTSTNIVQEESMIAPETVVQEQLVAILTPLLGLEQIGIDDNFFMLGGHSLLGTQVIVRIAERFGVDLSLRMIFEAPTVRDLSSEIESRLLAKVAAMSDEEAQRLLEQGHST